MIEPSKVIKTVVNNKVKYTNWAIKEENKAEFQVDLIMPLDYYSHPRGTIDNIYKEMLEQAENVK